MFKKKQRHVKCSEWKQRDVWKYSVRKWRDVQNVEERELQNMRKEKKENAELLRKKGAKYSDR